jgi:hypothetical protein
MPNPFFVGGPVPPEHFVGRANVVNMAFDQIASRSHLAVYGSDGMGKSSLLKFLATPQTWQARGLDPSAAFIVYLNCTDVNPFTPSAFWRDVLELLKDKAEGEAALQTQIDEVLEEPAVEKGDLRRVLRKIGQRNKFLILLLDEYDAALRPNEKYTEAEMLTFLSEFRNLAVHSEEGRDLSTIVTSFRRLNELGPKLTPSGSPWYNHYLFQPLKPFTEAEVAESFNRKAAEWALTPTQQDAIKEIADRHPALLQQACFLLYNNLHAEHPTTDAREFTRDFANTTEHFFRDAWAFSTEEEQLVLMLIALSRLEGRLNQKRQYKLDDADLILSQREHALRDLEERGVIQHTREGGKDIYSFASSVMEWWVIKQIENSKDEAELQQWEKAFLNLSRKQVDQLKNVVRQVWQHKDAVESIAGWMGKVAGAFFKGVSGGGAN